MTIPDDRIKEIVREAVREELRGANIIDGPTHIMHHQALDEMLELVRHAKKSAVGWFVKGIVVLLLFGCLAWVAKQSG